MSIPLRVDFTATRGILNTGSEYLSVLNSIAEDPKFEMNISHDATAPVGYEANSIGKWNPVGLTGGNTAKSQSVLVNTKTNSKYALHMESNDTPTADCGMSLDLNGLGLINSVWYMTTFWAKHIETGDDWEISFDNEESGANPSVILATITSTDNEWVKYHAIFPFGSTYRYLVARERGTNNSGGVLLDDLQIVEVDQSLVGVEPDLVENGNIYKKPVASGAELFCNPNLNASTYWTKAHEAGSNFGTGEFTISVWSDLAASIGDALICSKGVVNTSGFGAWYDSVNQQLEFKVAAGNTVQLSHTPTEFALYHFIRVGGDIIICINGVLAALIANASSADVTASLYIGGGGYYNGSGHALSAFKIQAGALTTQQRKSQYNSEKHLFRQRAVFTITGQSYFVEFYVDKFDPSHKTIGPKPQTALNGSDEVIIHREENYFDVTTAWIPVADMPLFREFMYSVRARAMFTLATSDIYQPNEQMNVKMVSNSYKEDRVNKQGTTYWQSKFKVKIV